MPRWRWPRWKFCRTQIPVAEEVIRAGLAIVNWPGRLQLIQQPDGQKILLDGAHNAAGAEALRAALEKDFAGVRPSAHSRRAGRTRTGRHICGILAPLAARVIHRAGRQRTHGRCRRTGRSVPRSQPAAEIAGGCQSWRDALETPAKTSLSSSSPARFIWSARRWNGSDFRPAGAGERGLNEWTAAPPAPAISSSQV